MASDKGLAMKMWRASNILYKKHIPILPGLIMRIIRLLLSCDIPYKVEMGEGVLLVHNGLGVVINERAVIGNNVKIMQQVLIGGRGDHGTPIIEDDVFIGAKASILGGVTIGKGAIIGAHALVLCDVPPNSTAIGVPAKIIINNNGTQGKNN